jgi:calcineurin-like phosphoesterase
MEQEDRICKPANYPPGAPGREFALATDADGTKVAVISLIGRTFMRSADCPFQAVDRVLKNLSGFATVVIVDMHAEATADKYLMGHFLNGRVAAVLGTHTHVPTADEQLMPGGTAFICDVGMTGPYSGILGRKLGPVLSAAITNVPAPFDVATDDVRLGGAIVDVDALSGKATAIERVMIPSSA